MPDPPTTIDEYRQRHYERHLEALTPTQRATLTQNPTPPPSSGPNPSRHPRRPTTWLALLIGVLSVGLVVGLWPKTGTTADTIEHTPFGMPPGKGRLLTRDNYVVRLSPNQAEPWASWVAYQVGPGVDRADLANQPDPDASIQFELGKLETGWWLHPLVPAEHLHQRQTAEEAAFHSVLVPSPIAATKWNILNQRISQLARGKPTYVIRGGFNVPDGPQTPYCPNTLFCVVIIGKETPEVQAWRFPNQPFENLEQWKRTGDALSELLNEIGWRTNLGHLL